MDEVITISEILLTPLNVIYHPKGSIYHALKQSDLGYEGFGEAYFSSILGQEIKGWNRHKIMTMNLVVPIGSVTFVIEKTQCSIQHQSNFEVITLSPENYQRLTVPPGLWVAFRGNSKGMNLILNLASIEHDPKEKENLNLETIKFDWASV
jgi:dTDP-4-dehydrorhamnose 3,5-epimerase